MRKSIACLKPENAALALMTAPENELIFSVASLWEIVIKRGLGRDDFQVDPRVLRRSLLDNGYQELVIQSEHAVAVDALPQIHRDPFDRLLVALKQWSKASHC